MKAARVHPNVATYVSSLKACGIAGSLEFAEGLHNNVRMQGSMRKNVVLNTAFVDTYSKCGALNKAREAFEALVVRDVVAWNALIAGYGHSGQADAALDLYIRMRDEETPPNSITFLVLLNACSHAGLIKEGEMLFEEMTVIYGIPLALEHYTCMIDLFGRAGCLEKVECLLASVPNSGHLPLFQSILGSCRKWKNAALGRWAFDQIVELDEACAAAYVSLGNIYATASMQLLE
jgi:pentatricopeptide repeat protein